MNFYYTLKKTEIAAEFISVNKNDSINQKWTVINPKWIVIDLILLIIVSPKLHETKALY